MLSILSYLREKYELERRSLTRFFGFPVKSLDMCILER